VEKVALGILFSEHCFLQPITFLPVLHINLSSKAGTTGPHEVAVPWDGLISLLYVTTVGKRTAFKILYYSPL
jgi:hypothetical protein